MYIAKKVSLAIAILAWGFTFTSCCRNDPSETRLSFPFGIRAKKKKLQPPYEFASAILDCKKQKGFWPVSETALLSENKQTAVSKLYNAGFLSWEIGFQSLDTLVIHFTHEPVYTQLIGCMDFPGRKVKLRTTFVGSTYSYLTELER